MPKITMKQFITGLNSGKVLDEAISKDFMNKLGTELSEDIKKRTRLGYGVADHGAPSVKLKPLSNNNEVRSGKEIRNTSYIAQRKAYSRKGKLASVTSPSKSNLTLTGQMLDDIVFKYDGNGTLTFGFGSDESEQKAYHAQVDPGDRPFFYLNDAQMSKIERYIRDAIRKAMNSFK